MVDNLKLFPPGSLRPWEEFFQRNISFTLDLEPWANKSMDTINYFQFNYLFCALTAYGLFGV